MKNPKLQISKRLVAFCILHFAVCISAVFTQSVSQSYPTPITTNEISGTIKPRDIGDARLTDYFYTFNAAQGDVFINVVATNLNGDIDIFNADGLKPLSKIVIYADASVNETGRVIYFRKPEKLILRVEGRTPNDEPATFKIKFAGSFMAAAKTKSEEPSLPEVTTSNQTDVRVNSVGTIIEVKPKPTPTPIETVAKNENSTETVKEISIETSAEKSVIAETDANNERKIEVKELEKKLEVVVTDNLPVQKDKSNQTVSEVKAEKTETPENVETENKPSEKSVNVEAADAKIGSTISEAENVVKTKSRKTKKSKTTKAVDPALLESVRLITLFKDGAKLERSMNEVLKVGVDKGILTVISKDGSIGRYSILDVAKMTIE